MRIVKKPNSFATRAIHAAYDPSDYQGALNPPSYMSSTFAFPDAATGSGAFAGEENIHFYSRVSNPTLDILENRIANLESAESGLAVASGMGAISSIFMTFLSAGDEIIVDKTVYGCSFSLLHHGLKKFGVKITHVDMNDLDALRDAMNSDTKIVYTETIANPNMRVADIGGISDIVQQFEGCRMVVDNTYLSPALFRPLEHGADIVVHSATKYIGGHGDLVAGLIAGSQSDMQEIRLLGLKDMTGAVLSPLTATLVLRGIKTLSLRMKQHSTNALVIAKTLQAHPLVSKVYYPGLESSEYYDLANEQFGQSGGVLAFELDGDYNIGVQFMDGLNLVTRAVSLGDAETLIQHPASMTHSTYTPEEREAHGISETLLRLAVGLEEVDDIWADIEQSLNRIKLSVSNVIMDSEFSYAI